MRVIEPYQTRRVYPRNWALMAKIIIVRFLSVNLAFQCLLPAAPAVRTLQLFSSVYSLSLQSFLIAGLDEHTQA